ncbi:sensor histidine kinase [Roseibium sp. Sym1]|uniref:sensor histidine kinase n=1 Tax=Roseibium sp. Sym1 TaxID=3016006 RepID=UPI0022B4F55E|nr:MASE1 domain-containing protein [Roseibium sp. Sym1]
MIPSEWKLSAPAKKTFNIASQFGRVRPSAQLALVTVVFFALAVAGIILTRETGRVAWIWLPNAALLAIVLTAPPSRIIQLMIAAYAGNLAANLFVGDTLSNALVLSALNTLEVSICVLVLKRLCPRIDLSRPIDLLIFALVTGGLATATVGSIASLYLQQTVGTEFWPVFINWYGADALGMLIVAPFLLVGIPLDQKKAERDSLLSLQSLGSLLLCVGITSAVFVQSSYPFLFVVMLPLALTAFTTGVSATALATLSIAALSIGFTIHGTGPFALMQADLSVKVITLQIFLVSCVLFGLCTAAVVTQQRRLQAELIRLTEVAQQANAAKSEFLSTVNHELRTPLTSIRGAIGLLAGGAGGSLPEKAQNLLKISKLNCERLLILVNDILEIEKIESGKYTADTKKTKIRKSLEDAVLLSSIYMPDKEISLSLIDRTPNCEVKIDEDRFKQAILNLISNAIKFSPAQSAVELCTMPGSDNTIRISVKDQGPGIPDDFADKVFQKFEQAEKGSTRKVTGTGLGLSITKALIELMDGTIGFRRNKKVGTEFFIDLPTAMPPEHADLDKRLVFLAIGQDNVSESMALATDKGWVVDLTTSLSGLEILLKEQSYDAVIVSQRFVVDPTLSDIFDRHGATAQSEPLVVADTQLESFLAKNGAQIEQGPIRMPVSN